ncbi:SgcJ/EcaC family oxidoreductase [Paenibacillus sp. GCM10023248]|uniref:SgcJ/EcaC family oxidoreductase n=1 Tax=unclassified Paenibacillus TaxID=185978 RepID=UPI0023786A15|nr:SgcJ/EcaC family oxidoreductase [Paenibacillus sp. MAHUQ-63]MDD9268522.1 SgcJ/EcaC family oxidoreductase [Paenibacillus sp. MAHUQ-63]
MTNQEDLKGIRALFTELGNSWNHGDGVAFGNCFTEDADYVTFMGQHLKGRKQIADVHQMLFNGPLKGSILLSSTSSDLQPRFIASDIAIVHAAGEVRLAEPAQDPNDRGSINTNVVMKDNGEWKLTAFHNCRIQEVPRGKR